MPNPNLSDLRAAWAVSETAPSEQSGQDGPDEARALLDNFCGRLGREEEVPPSFSGPSVCPAAWGPGATRAPSAGQEWFGFRLCRELGQGSFAQVFLATQTDLAGRPVVLKISPSQGEEPQTLAHLQHTHIVPIHSLHEDAGTGLRAVCMPYFGGASLDRILRALWAGAPTALLGGEQIAQALAQVSAGEVREDGQALAVLRRSSYVEAVVWVVARLAEALQHAHERGILHRDVKPSNILLCGDSQPMLLDFNLAENLHRGPAQPLGGTVAYMAPEHLRALRACGEPSVAVDHRADIYSLGLVLSEMLLGQLPSGRGSSAPLPLAIEMLAHERSLSPPSLRRTRPDLPWGLESVVRKCLAPDPNDRYQQAEHLAEDLRRFLGDRPLKHAPELSRAERVRKWARRHPRLTSAGSVLTGALLLLAAVGGLLLTAQAHLRSALDRERNQNYQAGAATAFCLASTASDCQDHLPQAVAACERTLALFEVLERDDWQARPAWLRQPPAARTRLSEESRDLLVLLAWARVRSGADGSGRASPEVLRNALALLDRAEAVYGLGPSAAVGLARAAYRAQLGDEAGARAAREQATRARGGTAHDHYLLAVTYLLERDPKAPPGRARQKQILEELNEAIRLEPRHYGSWLLRGLYHQEQGEFTLAAADFSACVGLWPEFSWGYFNRGRALQEGGKLAEAVEDYSAALARDPGLLLALWNRGLVYQMLERYEPALADLDGAARLGKDDAYLHVQRGLVLERLGRPREAEESFERAFDQARQAPARVRTDVQWWYGIAVHSRRPERARSAFAEVLRADPNHPEALYGLGLVLVEQGQPRQALAAFERALAAKADFVDARRARAVLLARDGQVEFAHREINRCLEREPQGGKTLYAAACVCALASEKALLHKPAEQALDFLKLAFARGYGRDRAEADPDLARLRTHPGFRALLEAR